MYSLFAVSVWNVFERFRSDSRGVLSAGAYKETWLNQLPPLPAVESRWGFQANANKQTSKPNKHANKYYYSTLAARGRYAHWIQ